MLSYDDNYGDCDNNNNTNMVWWVLSDLGRKITERSGNPLDGRFLFQRISVLIQRFNAIVFH